MSDYDSPVTTLHYNPDLDDLSNVFGQLSKEDSNLKTVNDTAHITKWLLEKGEDYLGSYRRDYVVGGEFSRIDSGRLLNGSKDMKEFIKLKLPGIGGIGITVPKITIMNGLYNSIPVHSRPLAVNFISNTLLGHLDNSNNSRKITVTNHPLPYTWTVSITKSHNKIVKTEITFITKNLR